ncbi:MAG TPA: hypothetical protein PLV61_17040, partial [Parvularculaceae bacterium]|nr:hypothetical protein [Parvularculaceae bacterium]
PMIGAFSALFSTGSQHSDGRNGHERLFLHLECPAVLSPANLSRRSPLHKTDRNLEHFPDRGSISGTP